ncbi:MAG: sensor histidine kinase, partial [Cellulosilyticaceae bacterium]
KRLLAKTIIIYPMTQKETLDEPILFIKEGEVTDQSVYITPDEKVVAEWVYRNNKNAGATTNTLPGARSLYLAVRGSETVFAVVAIAMAKGEGIDAFERSVLIAMLSEFGLALEKQAIIEMNNQIALKVQREQLRGNLLRAISHDLRTPLMEIYTNVKSLKDEGEHISQKQQNLLYDEICEDAVWLINLIENLLAVTGIENDALSLQMEMESIEKVVSEALKHISRKATEHHITVSVERGIQALMNAELITQVLINLIDNAIAYTQIGSHIQIDAKKVRSKVVIEVSDNGSGISDDVKKHLFDMLYRGDVTTVGSKRAMGLGLPLCRMIIHAHGGELMVRDCIPNGTLFGFTLEARD